MLTLAWLVIDWYDGPTFDVCSHQFYSNPLLHLRKYSENKWENKLIIQGHHFSPPTTPLHWIFVCPFLSHHYETKLLWKKNQLLANCLLKLEPNFLQVCSFLFSPQFPHSFAKWLLRVLYNVKNFEIWPVNFLFLSCSRSTIQEDWAKALIL